VCWEKARVVTIVPVEKTQFVGGEATDRKRTADNKGSNRHQPDIVGSTERENGQYQASV